jgi:hypothetical protein
LRDGEIKTSKEQIRENKPRGKIYKMSRNLEGEIEALWSSYIKNLLKETV